MVIKNMKTTLRLKSLRAFFSLVIGMIILCNSSLSAQDEKPVMRSDTLNLKSFGFLAYPFVFYSPETEIAFGAGGIVFFRTTTRTFIQPSKVVFSGYYTSNKQYYIGITPEVYFPGKDTFFAKVNIVFSKEILKFYGIGNDSPEIENAGYEMDVFKLNAEVYKKNFIFSEVQTGINYNYSNNDMVDKKNNPNLVSETVPGHDGGRTAGFGLGSFFDSRDNLFYPAGGGYYKFSFTYFSPVFGSSFEYGRYILDIRRYYSKNDHILAVQIYGALSSGYPPFFDTPALGGSMHMRGYFEGRYRDRQYLTGQLEYRKIFWWRIGGIAFISAGDVADRVRDFTLGTFKISYGFGLRFVFDEEERINVRVDYGRGKGTDGIYFNIEEAF